MKLESRGKYPGVKVHLDEEECQLLLDNVPDGSGMGKPVTPTAFLVRLTEKLRDLLKNEPGILQERTPEQVAAILVKEVEKASMQLNAVKSGKMWQKVNQGDLQTALLKHVHKEDK